MSFVLERMTEQTFPECVGFLRREERRCVTLSSHFASDGKPRYNAEAIADAFLVFAGEGGRDVTGVIARTATGIVLHCLDLGAAPPADSLKAAVRRVIGQQTVRCVLGSAAETRFLEDAISRRPYRSVDYTLMLSWPAEGTAPSPPPAVAAPCADGRAMTFVRCVPADAEALLSLQEGYEREEVVPPGDPFDRKACGIVLARSLERQAIYAARIGGAFVAKAGTNARGLEWDQLGGVYTDPEWRGRGIARALISHVVKERRAAGRKIALFVKNGNETARKVYEDTGFLPDSPFRISYF